MHQKTETFCALSATVSDTTGHINFINTSIPTIAGIGALVTAVAIIGLHCFIKSEYVPSCCNSELLLLLCSHLSKCYRDKL